MPHSSLHRYGVESTEPLLLANYMPHNHTGEQVKDALSTSFDERGLNPRKIVAINTDSGSNIKLAESIAEV